MADNKPTFGIQDCKVATWDGDGTYTSPTDVWGIRQLGIQENVTTADLDGDDELKATAAKVNYADITLERASLGFEAMAIITGQTVQSSSGGAGRYIHRTNKLGPYIGVGARVDDAELTGDMHIFVPKCRLVAGQAFTFQYGQFTIPSMTLRAVPDENFLDEGSRNTLYRLHDYPVARAVAFPPAL